jgi:hypothetical protein
MKKKKETILSKIKSKINENKKCSYCKKNGHSFSQCDNIEIKNIYEIFNNELNKNINYNLDFYVNIIYFMYESKREINYKYLYVNPIGIYIKQNLEKLIKKKNLMEKKIISKVNYLPTSYPQSYLIHQLIEEYFNIFIENFKKKEEYLKIILDENFNFENLLIFLKKNNFYDIFDILLIIILLIKVYDIDVNFLIDELFKIYNIINQLNGENNTNEKKNKLYNGILLGIEKLIELEYEFEKENENYKLIIDSEYLSEENINIKKDELYMCPICYEEFNYNKIIKTECNHNYCSECFKKLNDNRKAYNKLFCAMCRKNISKIIFYG